MGRFINADGQLDSGDVLGLNLFAYCNNNPVMYSDTTGMAPEWWQWAISSAMFVAGVVLVATGVGGAAGGALICAGVNSIIGSYTAESAGGSSTAGWIGGALTGLICGTGAGIAGDILFNTTEIVGGACLGKVALGFGVSFATGTVGSLAGQYITATIDGKDLDGKNLLTSSLATGTINCFSAIGAGMGNALKGLPTFTETSKALANTLNAMCGISAEAICDALSVIISLFN